MNFNDEHFENIQLMKLVNSAEAVFHRLYNRIDDKQKLFVDQWLCLKQEYDSVCNNSTIDSYENLDESSMLSPIDEVTENENSSITSSASSRPMDTGLKNLHTAQRNELENMFCKKSRHVPYSTTRKTDLDYNVDEYMTELKIYTDVLSSLWISNLSFSLLVDEENNCRNNNNNNNNNNAVIVSRGKTSTAVCNIDDLPRERSVEMSCSIDSSADGGGVVGSKQRKSCNQNQRKITNKNGKCYNKNLKCEIQHLQELRLPLLQMRRNIMDSFRNTNEQLETSTKFRDYLKFEVIIEAMDISIEMKNQLRLGHNILDPFEINDQADTAMADCFSLLSLDEIKCLLITFLRKVIDIRESSTKLDKEILKQDNFVFYQKLLIRNLNKTIHNTKLFYESQFVNVQKECEGNLVASRREINFPHNDKNPESKHIVRKPELMPAYSTSRGIKVVDQLHPVNFQTGNLSDVKVTRQKNKLIIQQEKSAPR